MPDKKQPTKSTAAKKAAPAKGAGASDTQAPDTEARVTPGQVVRRRYFDPYTGAGGQDVVAVGIVTEVLDKAARVAWLSPSDPVPLDELE